jgi:hypothetical protein
MEQGEQAELRKLNGHNPVPDSVALSPEEIAVERTRIRALFDRIDTGLPLSLALLKAPLEAPLTYW